VINLSLGTDANSKVLRDVIQQVISQGVIVVAAAGNGGISTVQYPAAYEGVIGVTSVDDENRKAEFANYGEKLVDLAAPGVGIMSTMITVDGPGYASWSGTSMSTAFVSGAAALVLDQKDDAGEVDSSLLGSFVVARLTTSGTDLELTNPEYPKQIGVGLNVSAALDVTAPIPTLIRLPSMLR
jgi:subtilisin family serine protease